MAIKQLGVAPTNPQDAATKSYVDGGLSAETTRATAAETVICTSTTRPGSPHVGQAIFETNTNKVLYWQSAGTGWTPAWNQAWGRVSLGILSVTQSYTPGGGVDLLVISPVLVANRTYRVTGAIDLVSTAGSNPSATSLLVGGFVVQNGTHQFGTNSSSISVNLVGVILPVAPGAVEVKMTLAGGQGDAFTTNVSATHPGLLIVEDIGPNGVPA